MSINADGRGPLAAATLVNLNALGDTFLPINAARFITRNVVILDPSTTLAGSAAQMAFFTGAGGTGTTLSAAAVMTTLTSAAVFGERTVAATTAIITPTYDATAKTYGVYARVTVVHGSAATVSVQIYGDTP